MKIKGFDRNLKHTHAHKKPISTGSFTQVAGLDNVKTKGFEIQKRNIKKTK